MQLGQTVYYRYLGNTGGSDPASYSTGTWAGNVPFNYAVVTPQEYQQGLQAQINYYGSQPNSQQQLANAQNALQTFTSQQGVNAPGYVDPSMAKFQPNAPTPSEQYYTPEYQAQLAAQKASLSANGVAVSVGNGTGYVPNGTPGALLATNPTAYYQQYGGQPSPAGTTGTAGDGSGSGSGTTGGGAGGGSGTGNPNDPSSGLTGDWKALYDQLQGYLTKLQANGQSVNPSLTISPEDIAKFTAQAQNEINPYYASKLAQARQSLFQSLGYSTSQIQQQEKDLERQYGNKLNAMASNLADQGFAQSGIRTQQEGNLSNDTQSTIDQARASLSNSATNAAGQFASTYGTDNLPTAPTLGTTPRALPGQANFQTSNSTAPIYNLSPEVYNGLKGTEQSQQTADIQNRVSQLEGAQNQTAVNTQQRALTI